MLTIVKADRQVFLIERTAIFDSTGQYRYQLGRRWQASGPVVTFIMLNPSTADAERDDPTLRACIQFAQRWGHAALFVVNLFGYRTPHPVELKTAVDPVGVENDAYVVRAVAEAQAVVLGWGNYGGFLGRDRAVLSLLAPQKDKLYCLQINKSGQPRHPLYIKRETALSLYFSQARSHKSPTTTCSATCSAWHLES